ncbi:MAG TPA: META domain-containing protein [Pyrinomonadaceae bacterium]|nr:META domain-containing protein [Pyrinomonadaceae bacterium]
MKQKYLKSGLKLFVIIGLLNIGIFAQNNWRNDLSGKRWELTELGGKRIYSSKAFLEIEASQKRFSGNAGCNRMFGTVNLSDRNINFGGVGTTKMFCSEPGVMKLETDFTRALGKVTRFEKNGNNLSLYARNRLVLKFKGTEKSGSDDNSSLKLEDKKWVLESIKGRNLPKIETLPFINFDKSKKSAGGNTGCNVFGGNYSVTRDTIAITNIISTMRACIEDERMRVEREFKNGLENADRFEITGGKLNLYRNKTLLLTFRAENK